MESITYLKNIKISPKKMRFLLPAIKKLSPVDALDYLLYSPNKTGKIYFKAINSAISNAKNALKVQGDVLKFKLLTIEEGQKLRRFRPNARGTVRPIDKRFSHIKIILVADQPVKKAKAEKTEKAIQTKPENKSVAKKPAVKAAKPEKKAIKVKETNK